jgi:hypothetical protein
MVPTMLTKTAGIRAAFICVIAAGVAGSASAGDVPARVSSAKGEVSYAEPGSSKFKPLAAGGELPAGSTVRTGAGAEAVIVLVPGAAVRIAESSDVTLKEMAVAGADADAQSAKRKALLSLKDGTVSALIDPKRSKETDFKIQTPQGVAAARGTFYAVTVEGGKTYVGVKRGKVGVTHSESPKS